MSSTVPDTVLGARRKIVGKIDTVSAHMEVTVYPGERWTLNK